MKLIDIRHPDYTDFTDRWDKWRYVYQGGESFVDEYLVKFSARETDADFLIRKSLTYSPSFAKAAVNDIKNAIYQRTADVSRVGGSPSYQKSIAKDVDRRGNTMNSFIGLNVLPELLTMAKVGVYIDMPPDVGPTLADAQNKTPYIYRYKVEDILSWSRPNDADPNEFDRLLLRDYYYDVDEMALLPSSRTERYRYLWIGEDGFVHVQFFDKDSAPISDERVLSLTKIPFVLFELPFSLLEDVADYQIALLNLESSDINYARKSNFPFYVEQYDPRIDLPYIKPPQTGDQLGTSIATNVGRDPVVNVGGVQGRRYPEGLSAPQFIHPSPEPLLASIEKGKQLKEDIRKLVNLAVINLEPDQSLEAGLSFIGLILQQGENKIADYWAMYEGSKSPATITYPKNYSLKSEEDRQKEAEGKESLLNKIPSNTYKRELGKQIAYILLSGKVSQSTLQTVYDEIDKAPTMTSDPKVIEADLKNGLVSTETASLARGYAPDEFEKAKVDHEQRLRRIQIAQTKGGGAARGLEDLQVDQPSSSDEKKDKPKRGEQRLD